MKTEQDSVVTAQHSVKTQQDNLHYLKLELERRRALRDSNASMQEELERVESAVTAAELDISCSVVRFPVNGYITHLQIDVGDYATAGMTATIIAEETPDDKLVSK